MKVKCSRQELEAALKSASRIVVAETERKKAPSPVMTHIFLSSEDGRLKVAATDLSIEWSKWIGAEVKQRGDVAAHAGKLIEVVSLIADEEVTISAKDGFVKVEGKKTSARVKATSAQDFPVFPPADVLLERLSGALLSNMVNSVKAAADPKGVRPEMNGILVEVKEDSIIMVATDGFRMSISKAKRSNGAFAEGSMLVPVKAMTEAARALAKENVVEVWTTKERNQVMFRAEQASIRSVLSEYKFPPYRAVLPTQYDTRAVVTTSEMLNACRRARIFAKPQNGTTRLLVESGRITVEAQSDEMGAVSCEVEADFAGVPRDFYINVEYLIDALEAVKSRQAIIEIEHPSNKTVIRPSEGADDMHVIMPVAKR